MQYQVTTAQQKRIAERFERSNRTARIGLFETCR